MANEQFGQRYFGGGQLNEIAKVNKATGFQIQGQQTKPKFIE
jgi:hypothetical protein